MLKNKRKVILILAAALLAILGIVVLRFISGPKATVLMYHHLTEKEEELNSVTVTVQRMEKDLKWLKENGYQSVLPRELLAISEGKDPGYYAPESAKGMYDDFELGEKLVVITLDDGYESNYTLLYPLLQKYGMKAEINVVCSMIGDKDHPIFANWEQVKEMSDSGLVEIGSHSYNMHNPGDNGHGSPDGFDGVQMKANETEAAFKERVHKDLEMSKEVIEEKLACPAVTFAYPYGAYDRASRKSVEEIFGVSLLTKEGSWHINLGSHLVRRHAVTMEKELNTILQ